MLAEAAKAARGCGGERPMVLGVTVLTSLDRQGLARVTGAEQDVRARVVALAKMAQEQGCDGVVASPQELTAVRQACGSGLAIVTPGIRLGSAVNADDQVRTMTPAEAAAAGADYIVVGRPVTDAADPLKVVTEIRQQLGGKG
jgi:orotidine-5'-phosphate decarboxylase